MKKPKPRLCPEGCQHLEHGLNDVDQRLALPTLCCLNRTELTPGKWGGIVRQEKCTDEWLDREGPPRGFIVCVSCENDDSGWFDGWRDVVPRDGWERFGELPLEDDEEREYFGPTHEGLCPECAAKRIRQKTLFT